MLRRRMHISPCGILCHCSTSQRSSLGNIAAWKGYNCQPRNSQRYSIGDISEDLDCLSRLFTSLSCKTAHCLIAGMGSDIVLREEKLASNSMRDRSDMWVKDVTRTTLACKCAPYNNKLKSVYFEVCKVNIPLHYRVK